MNLFFKIYFNVSVYACVYKCVDVLRGQKRPLQTLVLEL